MGKPENIAAAVAAGALTPNEARELLGLEPTKTDRAQTAQYYPTPKPSQHGPAKTAGQTRSHSRSMDCVLRAAAFGGIRR
jgi:hypothetical protein